MLAVTNRLHDRVNVMVEHLLFESIVNGLADSGAINRRQHAVLRFVAERPIPPAALRREPWYVALYERRTERSRQRDLYDLRERGFMRLDADGMLRAGAGRGGTE